MLVVAEVAKAPPPPPATLIVSCAPPSPYLLQQGGEPRVIRGFENTACTVVTVCERAPEHYALL